MSPEILTGFGKLFLSFSFSAAICDIDRGKKKKKTEEHVLCDLMSMADWYIHMRL